VWSWVVADVDEIVRLVHFPGWHYTKASSVTAEVSEQGTVYVEYKIKDQDLFDRVCEYIRQYC